MSLNVHIEVNGFWSNTVEFRQFEKRERDGEKREKNNKQILCHESTQQIIASDSDGLVQSCLWQKL